MKKLSVAQQKGGVGKSTLTVHLAHAAVEAGLRVLLLDMDAQANLGLSFPAHEAVPGALRASALFGAEPTEATPEVLAYRDGHASFAIIRADIGLVDLDGVKGSSHEFLRRPGLALRRFAKDYDLCLIDTPPSLGVLLMSSLAASDFVVTPVVMGLFELDGLAELVRTIQVARAGGLNPRLRHVGLLPMKHNTRSKDQLAHLAELRAQYGAAILPEELPEREPVKQAIARRLPVWAKARGAGHIKAAKEWRAACQSILGRLNK